jgi:hypothetical protein
MAYIGNEPGLTNFIFGLDRFNGTGACTQFTLTRTTDDANSIEILVNSIQQDPINSYSVSGGVITFTEAPSSGSNNIVVIYRSSAIISYNNVTTAQILDGAVTSSKLATSISNNSTIAWNTANAAFLTANTPTHVANSAASYANSAFSTANAAFSQANSAASYANSAFLRANTPNHVANSAASYANSAFATANSASIYANAAFTSSNTKANIASPSFTGNVGIGTASPSNVLHVNGVSRLGTTTVSNSGTIELGIQGTGDRNAFIDFHSSGTPGDNDYSARMIRESGANGVYKLENLGTGGTQFADNGTIRGTVTDKWLFYSGQQGNYTDRTLNLDGPSITQPGIGFHAPGSSQAGCLLFSGNDGGFFCVNSTNSGFVPIWASAFNIGSDYRLKTDIVDLQSGLQDIMNLSPKKYTLFDSDKEARGFIAHEVSPHIPEAVRGEFNAENERGFPVYQTLDPAAILATAVAAIQELKVLVDNQAIEIQQLKEKLND